EIDLVLEQLEHMKKIIAAQQSYAKAQGVTEVCTLQEIVESALAIAGPALRNSRVEVVREYEELPAALLDRHRILQIVVNLVSNARHALEERGDAERRIVVRVFAGEDMACVEVRDNGIGIRPENLDRIFTHGFTTRKAGHGFGLHNSANAAQQMGGSLTARSEGENQGASFVLRVPLCLPEAARKAAGA